MKSERGREMEVMTYILWVLLVMGSAMKNYMGAVSVPRTGQAVVGIDGKPESFSYTENKNANGIHFQQAINSTLNKQNFSWVDTS
jgi:hypothetical protein